MPVDQDGCLHLFTRALRKPLTERRHGWQYVDQITCNDCPEKVLVRTFDDQRDDNSRFLPPDGPAGDVTKKE